MWPQKILILIKACNKKKNKNSESNFYGSFIFIKSLFLMGLTGP